MSTSRGTVRKTKKTEFPSFGQLVVWGIVLWGIGTLAGVIN